MSSEPRRGRRRAWSWRGRWRLAAWWSAVIATGLNAFVVGYGSIWFQLFGSEPDREDYLVSAGGYLSGAVVLAAGAIVARRAGAGPLTSMTAAVAALVCVVAGLSSVASAADQPSHPRPSAGPLDGVGGVVLLPWSLFLLGWAARAGWDRLTVRSSGAAGGAAQPPD